MTEPPRVMTVIGRLAVGGAAIQAVTLTRLLKPECDTLLVTGTPSRGEIEMTELLQRAGVDPTRIPGLRREFGLHDLRALVALVRMIRRVRPQVVHTHAAKGGAIGRLAAMLAGGHPRPVVVHTFHGHVLAEYFSPRTSYVLAAVERALGRCSTMLLTVSPEIRDELLALRIGKAEQLRVLPIGLDLEPFLAPPEARLELRADVRARLGIAQSTRVVCLVARLVPVKRVDRFLEVIAELADLEDVCFVVVGEGELRSELEAYARTLGVADRLVWAGYRTDIAAVLFATDLVVVTSQTEGTPISLIEAQAAAIPVVSTRVGGAPSVVTDGVGGFLVAREDTAAFAASVRRLLANPALAQQMGDAGRRHVLARYTADRLVTGMLDIYAELLAQRGISVPWRAGSP